MAVGRIAFSTPLLLIYLASLVLWAALGRLPARRSGSNAAIGEKLGEKIPMREVVVDGFPEFGRWEMHFRGL
jgi:hypothetical protein